MYYKEITWSSRRRKREIAVYNSDKEVVFEKKVFSFFSNTPSTFLLRLPATKEEFNAYWRERHAQHGEPIRRYWYKECVTPWLNGRDTILKNVYKPNRHAAKHSAAWKLAEKLNMGSL